MQPTYLAEKILAQEIAEQFAEQRFRYLMIMVMVIKIIINVYVWVTLKNNIILLRETKWRHGAAASCLISLAVEWLNFRRELRVKVLQIR